MPHRDQDDMKMQNRGDLMATLAHHDAQIGALGGRMSGVENQMKTLQGEVHAGFSHVHNALGLITSKLDKQEAQPRFDFHRTISTIATIAVLFGMIVSGIVWITTGQFSGAWSKQEAFNTGMTRRVESLEDKTEKLIGWIPTVEPARKR